MSKDLFPLITTEEINRCLEVLGCQDLIRESYPADQKAKAVSAIRIMGRNLHLGNIDLVTGETDKRKEELHLHLSDFVRKADADCPEETAHGKSATPSSDEEGKQNGSRRPRPDASEPE